MKQSFSVLPLSCLPVYRQMSVCWEEKNKGNGSQTATNNKQMNFGERWYSSYLSTSMDVFHEYLLSWVIWFCTRHLECSNGRLNIEAVMFNFYDHMGHDEFMLCRTFTISRVGGREDPHSDVGPIFVPTLLTYVRFPSQKIGGERLRNSFKKKGCEPSPKASKSNRSAKHAKQRTKAGHMDDLTPCLPSARKSPFVNSFSHVLSLLSAVILSFKFEMLCCYA